MPYSCLIIDDEPPAIRILERFLLDAPELQVLGTYTNARDAMAAIRQAPPDLVFLDIHLPDLSGIALLKALPNPPLVIFTTAYPNYALEGFDLQAIDYLLKPFSPERFLRAVNRALDHLTLHQRPPEPSQQYLTFRADRRIHRIPTQEIRYLQAYGDYVRIATTQGKHTPKITLAELEQQLPTSQFIRIHRAYLVNLAAVNYLEGNALYLGTEALPVSKHLRSAVIKALGLE